MWSADAKLCGPELLREKLGAEGPMTSGFNLHRFWNFTKSGACNLSRLLVCQLSFDQAIVFANAEVAWKAFAFLSTGSDANEDALPFSAVCIY